MKFDVLQNGLEEIENDVNKATVHKCGLEGKTHNGECWQEMAVQEKPQIHTNSSYNFQICSIFAKYYLLKL